MIENKIEENINSKLNYILKPNLLIVNNLSKNHINHQEMKGIAENLETHFEIIIFCKEFKNKTRLERSKLIHTILKEEIEKIHSLSIKAYDLEEYAQFNDKNL